MRATIRSRPLAGARSYVAGFQHERVRVEMKRKLRAKGLQRIEVERRRPHTRRFRHGSEVAAGVIDDGAAAAVLDTVAVRADPVHAGDEREVLDRPRAQQRLPGVVPRRRPVRGVHEQVVVVAVAAPQREAQVVAHQGPDAEILQAERHELAARRIVLVLARQPEQVALVVVIEIAVGAHENHAIHVCAAVLDDQAAANDGPDPAGRVRHPGDRAAVHAFRIGLRVHRESGREHFREHDQVRLAVDVSKHASELAQVGFRIVPVQVCLHDRDV